MKDLFGKAMRDYHLGNYSEDLITATSLSLPEILPVPYLFRTFTDMPNIEQVALASCRGSILDVGCGSGVHLEYLSKLGHEVKGIDSSSAAVEICRSKGLHVENVELLKVEGKYDTILLLMNGTGIFEKMGAVASYLKKLKTLLKPGGQVLIDSSDVIYLFDESGEYPSRHDRPYYGELDYFISYKGESEDPMSWLYIDRDTFKELCDEVGFSFEVISEGDHYDYLARITCS